MKKSNVFAKLKIGVLDKYMKLSCSQIKRLYKRRAYLIVYFTEAFTGQGGRVFLPTFHMVGWVLFFFLSGVCFPILLSLFCLQFFIHFFRICYEKSCPPSGLCTTLCKKNDGKTSVNILGVRQIVYIPKCYVNIRRH